ncbi:MAG: alpha/beta hydrolase [Proteobacteria bacterium]|nr:MAG: alpha/beta hydrolase [Pseudomonadota bacterium]
MKQLFTILFAFACFCTHAQNEPPSAAQIRGMIEGEISSFNIPPEPVHSVSDITVWTGSDSVKIRIYYPGDSKNLPAVFNIHGGALVAGNLESHDNISRIICHRSNSIVIALDYRKPPEKPYPAGFNDTWAILKWINTNAAKLGIDKNNIMLLSDSGGSLFAAAIPARIRKENSNIRLIAEAFINPALDLRQESLANANPFYKLVAGWYLGNTRADDPQVSPLASNDWRTFPPTMIITCEKDELKPHGDSLASKLKLSGISTRLINLPGEDHLGGLWAAGHERANPAITATLLFIADLRKVSE